LTTRILKVGSNKSSDKLADYCLKNWKELERKLGIELPLRVISYILSIDENNDELFSEIHGRLSMSQQEKMSQISGVLWTRGREVRNSELNFYTPYYTNATPEKLILSRYTSRDLKQVLYGVIDWDEELIKELIISGEVDLIIEGDYLSEAASIVSNLMVNSIDLNGLMVFPRISKIKYVEGNTLLRIDIAEVIN
jgi:ATP-dependent helicase Lhr and Lhr-like helicase